MGRMTLEDLQRIKRWHVAHRHTHPIECRAWDAMLTLWLAGWVGWVPAFLLDAIWSLPLLILAIAAPSLYVAWRMKAHRERRIRCDWSYAALPTRN
jgi:hypothetical protein